MDNFFIKMLFPVTTVFVLVVFNANIAEAKSLKKGDVFHSLDKGKIVRIVSSDELEIEQNEEITVNRYSIDGDRLRTVITANNKVVYYKIISDGLVEEKSGTSYFNLATLEQKILEKLKKSMVFVKGGCFQMGDIFGDGKPDEKPVHEVCVDSFYIGKYEVTQEDWFAIMGYNPSQFKECDNCPVEQISWNDAQEYINKLNQKTGKKYRLPTEAEWEYAARSGGKKEKYAGSNDLDKVACYKKNSGDKTSQVGQKQPNGLGIYDMTGNNWELVQDWYDENYYKNSPKNNPKGPDSGEYRVYRGGSWFFDPYFQRVSYRYPGEPTYWFNCLGLRLSLTVQ